MSYEVITLGPRSAHTVGFTAAVVYIQNMSHVRWTFYISHQLTRLTSKR